MNVRAIAEPEARVSAEQVDPQTTPVNEGTTTTIPATSTVEGSGSNGTDFEAKMRAQLALITAPTQSNSSNLPDAKIETIEDSKSTANGKFTGKKLAKLWQRFSDGPSQLSRVATASARHSRLKASPGKDPSTAAPIDRAGQLNGKSDALTAPWIGCEPSPRAMATPAEDVVEGTSFDFARTPGSAQPGSPTLAISSNPGVVTAPRIIDSSSPAFGGYSQSSSLIGDNSQLPSEQNYVAAERAKGAGITNQADVARRVSTNETEQPANNSSLLSQHSNALSLTRPLTVSEVGGAIDPETKVPTYRVSTPLQPSAARTLPAAGSPMNDSASSPLSAAADQPVSTSAPVTAETRKASRSFRQSSADEFMGASNRERANSAHSALQGNGNGLLVGEISPSTLVSPTNVGEQRNQFRMNEAFTALDSGSSFESDYRTVQHGGRVEAEAGFQDPSLGWIGVRAETHAGTLHASVLSSSTEAAQALSSHLAGLHAYMADRNTPLESLTFVSTGAFGEQAAARDSREGAHQGSGDQTHDSTPQLSEDISERLAARSHSLSGAGSLEIPPIRSSGNSIGARISVVV